MKKEIKNEKGITLIILAVTIVVILILAAITVNITFQDEGVIKRAEAVQGDIDKTIGSNENRMAQLLNDVASGSIDTGSSLIPDSNSIAEGGGESGGDNDAIPSKPKVTVKGTEGEKGYYRSDIELVVNSNDRANTLTYTVEGTNIEQGSISTETTIGNGQSIYITQDGTYTVTIYEYNKNGKKSEPTMVTVTRDTVAPSAHLAVTKKGENSVTVQFVAIDQEPSSGLATGAPYTFYYQEEGSSTWINAGKGNTSSYTYEGLEEGVTYTFKAEATDKAGNIGTSNEVTAKTVDNRPQITLKKENSTGEEYIQGTWTAQSVYTQITTESEKEVEKYQYTLDGSNWYDISEERADTSLNYTMNFPADATKPDFIGELTPSNSTYNFVENGSGGIVSNNQGKHSSTASSYLVLNLEDYTEEDILNITINATISGESRYDFGYITITNDATVPAYNNSTGQLIQYAGAVTTKEITTSITGGKTYYLHFGYRKDGSGNSYNDEMVIHSITFQSDTMGKKTINFYEYNKTGNTVTYTLQDELSENIQIRARYTDGTNSKNSNCTVCIDKTAPIIENIQVQNYQTIDKATVQVNIKETGSGIAGYYINTDATEPTEQSNWTAEENNTITIPNIQAGTTYYIWVKDKAGNISEIKEFQIEQAHYQIDGSSYAVTLAQAIEKASDNSTICLLQDYADESTVNFTKNCTFDTGNYTLSRTKTITINSGKIVTIQGNGIITSGTANINTISNAGTLTLKGKVTVQNLSTSSSDSGIYNYVVTNVQEEATVRGPYGIYNNGSAYTVNVQGGKVIGTVNDGIYNGTVNITAGNIEGNRYGIYESYTNKITIGDIAQEVSTEAPIVYGKKQAVYMNNTSDNFAFYNGKLKADQEATYRGNLQPRDGHITYTYYGYEERVYCTVLDIAVSEIQIQADPTTWTNQDVNITIYYPTVENATNQYSLDGTNWINANTIKVITHVSNNTTVQARILDSNQVVLQEESKTIEYIDKIAPVVTITPSNTRYTITDTNPNADISFTIEVTEEGGSGIAEQTYAWTTNAETPSYQNFENGKTIQKTGLTQGTYYLWLQITDVAGNTAELSKIRYIVEYQEPVAQIGETTYTTIQEAINACEDGTQTTIMILKDTEEEVNIVENKNVILDLQGYTVESINQEQPMIQNAGTLQIIDTSTSKTGKLEKIAGTAIENTGTLTIGDNTSEIENETPTIESSQIGIKNTGTFQYYDGTIIGKTPIYGNITDTPEGYGPVATYENGKTIVTLDIVADYVARIEYRYYTSLQNAIEACTAKANNTNQQEITILKDIVLDKKATTYKGQNIKLDLDGYRISSSTIDKGIINHGDLEITDESVAQTGKIEISRSYDYSYGIYNNVAGVVKVSRRNG